MGLSPSKHTFEISLLEVFAVWSDFVKKKNDIFLMIALFKVRILKNSFSHIGWVKPPGVLNFHWGLVEWIGVKFWGLLN